MLTRLGELFAVEFADDFDEALGLLPFEQMAAVGKFDDAGVGHYVDHANGYAGREDLAVFPVGNKGGNVDAATFSQRSQEPRMTAKNVGS
jgi:hypothetical protein